ncbi:MAG: response regulator [Deltaproteobacteria bacterium]|nr:response regulator [Deltaproteobacteria bacterium]
MVSPVVNDVAQKSVRIMVVEDVDFNLAILTDILAERGWQTVAATSGEAALDILAQDTDFQIILMDIGLPGIDGVETTRRIKENPACRAIPVIALTADTASERERLLAAGLDGYAEKNFDPDQLFAAIDKHLFPACKKQQPSEPALAAPGEHLDLDFKALFTTYADEETLCRIAKAFFADTDKQIILLGAAMAAGDQTKTLACCHSLRGSSAIFTAKKLGAAAKELDALIRLGKKDEADSAWHRVLAAHESLRGAVTSRLNLSLQNE